MRCSTGMQSTSGVQPDDLRCTMPSNPSCAYLRAAAMVMLDVGPMSYCTYSEMPARRFFSL